MERTGLFANKNSDTLVAVVMLVMDQVHSISRYNHILIIVVLISVKIVFIRQQNAFMCAVYHVCVSYEVHCNTDVINVYNVYKKIFVNVIIILSTFISIKIT